MYIGDIPAKVTPDINATYSITMKKQDLSNNALVRTVELMVEIALRILKKENEKKARE